MIVTLPFPSRITQYFPQKMVWFLQWFAFYSFSALLIIPWTFCLFNVVTTTIGRSRKTKAVLHGIAPKVVVVMPVYNEEPSVLIKAVESVVECDYPPSCIHVFLSFDGEPADSLWCPVAEQLGIPPGIKKRAQSIDVVYKAARVTVSRFPHGGKRRCQKQTYKLIDRIYARYLLRHDDLFVLFIDSDCILDKLCLQNFMYDMELKPGSARDMLAMTGVVTSTTAKHSLVTLLQDMEYVHGQLFERSVESCCGSVTCLPGALTCLRFSAFRKMAKYYFEDQIDKVEDFFDYLKCHLGEDRWLTHLFMVNATKPYQIQMCASAFCKTEAVQTIPSLVKQRRRWFLGFITNEACMLTDVRIWRRYPVLCIIRLMQNTIRTTALLFFIMVVSVLSTSNTIADLPVGFIAISLGLNYTLMLYFGYVLKRYKAWLYPLMFLVNPFFNWMYLVYGCLTAGKRTWGGPRTDATKADEFTTPREATEQAEARGDDLNVDVSTFREYGQAMQGVPLHPTDSLEGHYSEGQESGVYYLRHNDSDLSLIQLSPRRPFRVALTPRGSLDPSTMGTGSPVMMPRRVESLVDEDERRKLQGNRYSPSLFGIRNDSMDDVISVDTTPDRLNWTPKETPELSGIPYVDLNVDGPSAIPEPLKQLQPSHPNPSPLGRHNQQRQSLEDDRPSIASVERLVRPQRKRRRLMGLGRKSNEM